MPFFMLFHSRDMDQLDDVPANDRCPIEPNNEDVDRSRPAKKKVISMAATGLDRGTKMALGLWDFALASLMFINAVAILNEERFLARCTYHLITFPNQWVVGWSKAQAEAGSYGMDPRNGSVKLKLVNLMSAVRTLMRSTIDNEM
jgi:hypothetical protein